MMQRLIALLVGTAVVGAAVVAAPVALGASPPPSSGSPTSAIETNPPATEGHGQQAADSWSMAFVLLLSTFIGLGVIARVSRLLHTPLMSITNAISAIAVVGAIIVTGTEGYPLAIRFIGAVALFASMTNIVSGFLITDRMLKMFKQTRGEARP